LAKATNGLEEKVLEKINTSIVNKKPAYLAALLVRP
jgi:hypothetical protein